ncbi:DUF4173 domain-containing protein [Sedimentibacter sp.]|uniref:DUF4153 domain-containing protein n=1 Tax=Sedimentibacter sp. TaxID=1960295 RepID=UPI002897CA1E|nr:DUF4173 domain-containing protein [Sedimentibacter sp.]
MESRMRINLLLYAALSAVTFIFLILVPNPGISIPLFFLVQLAAVYYVIRKREEVKNFRGILWMVPIIIISLNRLISAVNLWSPINFAVIVGMYSVMILMLKGNLVIRKLNIKGILLAILNVFAPIIHFITPFRWIAERSKDTEKNLLMKRILIGILISVPSVLFLVVMLSSADMVFKNNFDNYLVWIEKIFEAFNFFKLIVGTIVGLYLFGHLYSVFEEKGNGIENVISLNSNPFKLKGDVVILNILMVSILFIYTIFMVIQFRYLFSAGELPNGLNYAEYARRGFFELVFLSVLNIGLILLISYLLKDKIYVEKSKWAIGTKMMLIYLCIITGTLLVSSYYRMSLYDSAYGFTRLRILVYMFLFFEALGLAATLLYIVKHNFNLLLVYVVIGIGFYLTINVAKIDTIIAKRNIDMYIAGKTESLDLYYLSSLSVDAVPEMMRLVDDENVDNVVKNITRKYLRDSYEYISNMEYTWQSYNLSIEEAKTLLETNKEKLLLK